MTRHRIALSTLAVGLTTAIALACSPILGLDDLHDRAAVTTPLEDAGSDALLTDTSTIPESTCTTNVQCINEAEGRPALCRANKCVPLKRELCLPEVLPSNKLLENDNTIVVATFVPIRAGGQLAVGSTLAYGLALKEIQTGGGVPSTPGEPRHDIAMIFCASEPDLVEESVKHVTRDLKVPGMIASFGSADTTKLIQDYAVPANVFTVNPNVTPDTLKYANVNQLVWNLLGTADEVALAYKPLVARVEKFATTNGANPRTPNQVKVALINTDTVLEASIANVIQYGIKDQSPDGGGKNLIDTAIHFNGGKSSAENGTTFFRSFSIAAQETGGKPDLDGLVTSLATYQPDIIIAITERETPAIITNLEGKLHAAAIADGGSANDAVLPYWVLGPRNAQSPIEYLKLISANDRARFVGIQYDGPVDDAQRQEWLIRMSIEYGEAKKPTYEATENFYDAVYWLFYGIGARGPSPINGDSLRLGVRSLTLGPEINPGDPKDIGDAFKLIAFGKTTFVGALGTPHIDEKYGTWQSVGDVYCFDPADTTPKPHYDAFRYDTTKQDLIDGNHKCVVGF